VSTSTGISGCFQPGQAKVVLGPTPLLNTFENKRARKYNKIFPNRNGHMTKKNFLFCLRHRNTFKKRKDNRISTADFKDELTPKISERNLKAFSKLT
jgi:hypothetical protein